MLHLHTLPSLFFCCVLTLAGSNDLRAEEAVPEPRFAVSRYIIDGENPLSAEETTAVLSDYLGEFSGLDGLLAAADALEQALAKAGYSFHRVSLPPQTLENGVVTLSVLKFTLGKVGVAGQQHYSEANIRRAVPRLVPGETPDTRALSRNLAVANLNNARGIRVNLKRGETDDTLDAELQVSDRKPWNLYAALSNQGTPETGDLRLSVSAEHLNLWDWDHRLALNYTTAPDKASDLSQAGFSYTLPFYYSGGSFNLFYVYSDVRNVEAPQGIGQSVNGAGEFVGLSYTQQLSRRGGYEHSWTASFQDRDFQAEFADSDGLPDTRSRPVAVQYEGRYRAGLWRTAFFASIARNLGGGDNNDDTRYNEARPGASTGWGALRMGLTVERDLPRGWLGRILADGQYTTARLISGEQFGLGGLNSVRGYQERALSGDLGYRSSIELWSPLLPRLPGLRALTFIDGGYRDFIGDEAENAALGLNAEWIASIGAGIRYRYTDQVSAGLDYAAPFERVDTPDLGGQRDRRWYFSLLVRY